MGPEGWGNENISGYFYCLPCIKPLKEKNLNHPEEQFWKETQDVWLLAVGIHHLTLIVFFLLPGKFQYTMNNIYC